MLINPGCEPQFAIAAGSELRYQPPTHESDRIRRRGEGRMNRGSSCLGDKNRRKEEWGRGLGRRLIWWSTCCSRARTRVWISTIHIRVGRSDTSPVIPALRNWWQGIPGTSCLARLVDSGSSGFSQRSFLQKWRKRVMEKETQYQPHTHTCTHVPTHHCAQTHSSTHTWRNTTVTESVITHSVPHSIPGVSKWIN